MRHHRPGSEQGLLAEHPWADAGQIVLAILFLVVWIADLFFLQYTTFINAQVPPGLRGAIGLVNLLVAAYLAISSLRLMFGEKTATPRVIREGVFGIVRHPMYLSEILLALGLLLFSLSLAAAVIWAVAIGFLQIIAKIEERQLLAHFGEEYRNYMDAVPMWLPRVGQLQN